MCLSEKRRHGEVVLTPPNSNLLFADRAAVPVLRGELSPGTHLLMSAVWAGDPPDFDVACIPEVSVEHGVIHLTSATQKTQFSLTELPKE
jgi:hypothetical protein